MHKISIEHPSDANQRIDRFLKKYLPNAPLSGIYKMLRTGKIKVNTKKKPQTYMLQLRDDITFWMTNDELQNMKTQENTKKTTTNVKKTKKLLVLYEDNDIMVINKPSWLNVHAWDHKTKESNLIDQVQDYLAGRHDSLTFRPALVHRIDRDTSGCVLIAKNKISLQFLLRELQGHNIDKIYHTIVTRLPSPKEGTIQKKISRLKNAHNEAKVHIDAHGQRAVTHYAFLKNIAVHDPSLALLECRIETGRTHQIRVHLASIDAPIVGDKTYGDTKINSYIRRNFWIFRQMLHAQSLSFLHPKTKKICTIQAPYPEDFQSLLD